MNLTWWLPISSQFRKILGMLSRCLLLLYILFFSVVLIDIMKMVDHCVALLQLLLYTIYDQKKLLNMLLLYVNAFIFVL